MRDTDFSATAPGRLVPTVGGVLGFAPNPLPNRIALGSTTVDLLARAENALGRLAGTTARQINPYLVGSPLLHREAILSSRIEGTITTPEQLVLLQAENEKGTRARSHGDGDTEEVLNYIKAMRHGLSRLGELPVCLRLIREIHGVLLHDVRGGRERPGEFRDGQNWIRGRLSERIQDARFVPPPVSEMRIALDAFEEFLNADPSDRSIPELIRLALIHYQFEAIHPFRDGNGRVGRLLIALLLVSCGRLETPVLYLSSYFERNRDLYVDLLLSVSQTGDWTSWLDFFLRGVFESADESTRQSTALLALQQRYQREFQTARSSALLIRLIDRLFEVPSITIGSASRLLGITSQAAVNNLRKLQAAGILRESTGRRRDQVFIADEIMAFMHDQHEAEAHGE